MNWVKGKGIPMEKKCDLYTSEDISRYVDQELVSEKHRSMMYHLSLCPDCARRALQFKTLSASFSAYTDKNIKKINTSRIESTIEQLFPISADKRLLKVLFTKLRHHIYLSIAGVAAFTLIGFFLLDPDLPGLFSDPGPSAIVTSVDSEYDSVMILETQKDKHTIIWFSEKS